MPDRKQKLLAIIQAFERVKLASPPRGPGWSVCFRDAEDRLFLSFTLDSYQHVDELAREVSALGFSLTILEGTEAACDFVFRQDDGAPAAIADPAVTRKVDLPPLRRPVALQQGALVMEDAGGPVMLLSALSRDLAYCVWFSEQAQVCSGTFMVNRLVNVDAAKRKPVAPVGSLAS